MQADNVQRSVAIDSFEGKHIKLELEKRPGFELEDVLDVSTDGEFWESYFNRTRWAKNEWNNIFGKVLLLDHPDVCAHL